MTSANNILELIGHTPIVEVKNLDSGACRLFVKLENQNPGSSIKDRIALTMIEAAELSGKLKPGGVIVEATAGNTGLGLALVASQKGYKLILIMPDKMSLEKIAHLKALGAKVILTRSDVVKGHPEYYQDVALRIAQEKDAYYIDQFNNPANPLAHEIGTGPEIWAQMNHDLDAVVVGVGSGGTLAGLSAFFAKVAHHVEMVLADPKGSILGEYARDHRISSKSGSWLVEGIGEDFVPSVADFSRVTCAYTITDQESFQTSRDLLNKEGIFAGSSSGTLVAAALRYCKAQKSPKKVVTFICDGGNKYLSKMFNDDWMLDHGFITKQFEGNLKDIIARPFDKGDVITVKPDDTLKTTFEKMKQYNISQVPVLDGDALVGIVDESDILFSAFDSYDNFERPVRTVMTGDPITIPPDADIKKLLDILRQDYVAIVETEQGVFQGLITKNDLINFIRKQWNDIR